MESLFAFNHFDNDTDFLKAIADMSHQEASVQLGLMSKLFNLFEMNEYEHEILNYQGDLDPDKYYFNQYSHSLLKNCNYFQEESFQKHLSHHHISNEAFSMLHLNVRSIPANRPAFQSYLNILDHNFSIIGLTETWLKPSNIFAYCFVVLVDAIMWVLLGKIQKVVEYIYIARDCVLRNDWTLYGYIYII